MTEDATPPSGARRPMRRALRRIGDALLWAVLGAVVAPLALALGVGLLTLVSDVDAPVVGVILYYLSFSLLASIAFALPPYAALLVAWAVGAPCLGDADRSRRSVALATAALAVPPGLVVMLSTDGSAIATLAPIWLAAWIGLLLPRLVVPRLAPGAFARGHAPLHTEPSDA